MDLPKHIDYNNEIYGDLSFDMIEIKFDSAVENHKFLKDLQKMILPCGSDNSCGCNPITEIYYFLETVMISLYVPYLEEKDYLKIDDLFTAGKYDEVKQYLTTCKTRYEELALRYKQLLNEE